MFGVSGEPGVKAFVWGQAAWMPGRADVASVLAPTTEPDPSSSSFRGPSLDRYPSRLMRATSLLTQMCASVAARTVEAAGISGQDVPAVFASSLGEATIAIEQLEMMRTGDGRVSPARFKNSVHNTPAGVFSVAFGNHTMSTSLAAGPLSVAYAILEAQLILAEGASEVLVVVGDESMPSPLNERCSWPAFAAGWVLGRQPRPRDSTAFFLSDVVPIAASVPPVPSELREHPCQGAYRLLDAVHNGREGPVVLGVDSEETLGVTVGHDRSSQSVPSS